VALYFWVSAEVEKYIRTCRLHSCRVSALEPYDFRIRPQTIRDYGWSASLFVAMVSESKK